MWIRIHNDSKSKRSLLQVVTIKKSPKSKCNKLSTKSTRKILLCIINSKISLYMVEFNISIKIAKRSMKVTAPRSHRVNVTSNSSPSFTSMQN